MVWRFFFDTLILRAIKLIFGAVKILWGLYNGIIWGFYEIYDKKSIKKSSKQIFGKKIHPRTHLTR